MEPQIKSAWFEDRLKSLFYDNDGKLGQLRRPFTGERGKKDMMSSAYDVWLSLEIGIQG